MGIYHCGLTVQAAPHVGHIRKEVVFDVLRRWLEHAGLTVRIVANVTDIDDKVLVKSAELGVEWWELAYANERLLHEAYEALGCLPPAYEPRATGHVPEMLELIQTLIDNGHAYAAADGSGDVYFDVRSWPAYGSLSRQRIDDMEAAADADPRGKRDPRDFALWKGHKPDEPATASWPSPWGRGRPGWHLECSAMAAKYLGPEFDIHGGGLDLRFPHHENELAQSTAAGQPFARVWMHNAMVTIAGEKMSKSLGNSALVSEVVQRFRPVELRYYLVAPHYRSMVEFSDESLAEAAAAYRRLEGYVTRATEVTGGVDPSAGSATADFVAAMDDDLSTPAALAASTRSSARATSCWPTGLAGPAGEPGLRTPHARPARARPAAPAVGGGREHRHGTRHRRRAGRGPAAAAAGGARAQGLGGGRRRARPAQGRRRRDRGHPGRARAGPWRGADDVPGNSKRKGAIRKTSKGNPTAGSGGRVRRGLEGKGPTPKASDRPQHKAYRDKRAADKRAARPAGGREPQPRPAGARGDSEWVAGPQRRRRGTARARAGHQPLRRRAGRPRRPAARGVPHRGRAGHRDPRGAARRARPRHRRRRAPGRGREGAGLRVRASRRPACPCRRGRPAAAGGGARRCDRPAQPRCRGALGGRVRRARRRGARASGGGHDGRRLEDLGRRRRPAARRPGHEPRPPAGRRTSRPG